MAKPTKSPVKSRPSSTRNTAAKPVQSGLRVVSGSKTISTRSGNVKSSGR